jgi:hypothetical protein
LGVQNSQAVISLLAKQLIKLLNRVKYNCHPCQVLEPKKAYRLRSRENVENKDVNAKTSEAKTFRHMSNGETTLTPLNVLLNGDS